MQKIRFAPILLFLVKKTEQRNLGGEITKIGFDLNPQTNFWLFQHQDFLKIFFTKNDRCKAYLEHKKIFF